jgi:hypothetical protein
MSLLHSAQTRTEGVHTIIAYAYADSTARLAATGFTAADVGKVAIDLDTNNLNWLVKDDPITWATFDAGATAQLNKVRIQCRKTSAGTLSVGTVVYATGYDHDNSRALVEAAKADSASTLPAVGIIDQECTDSSTGTLIIVGVLDGVDTSAFSAQQPIYVSHTTAGAIAGAPPPGPYVTQALGVILSVDASDGHVGVNILGFRAIEYTTAPQALGVAATGTANTSSASDHVHPTELVDQAQIYYVGKHGNDSNSGKTLEEAFLTFGAALAEALSQTPSSVNAFSIQCFDAGGYVEDITVYSYCLVTAPGATIIGEVTLQDYSGIDFLQIRVGAGETAVKKSSGTETSSVKASGISCTGSGNAIKNDGTDSVIIAELDYIRVEDGDAIHDNSSGDGHIHVLIGDIYINGDGRGLVTAGGAGGVYAIVQELEDVGAGATTGIDVQTGTVRACVTHIDCDTAWSVASGATLEAFVGSVEGTQTETGTVNVTVAGESNIDLSDTAPVNVTKAAASAGTATEASRQDHKHDVTTATAASITPGDSAGEGSATSLARSDHAHGLPAFGTASGTFCQGNDARLSDARVSPGFSQTSSDSQSSTTSTTPVQKVRLTTGTLVSAAVYRIGWSFEWQHGSGSTNADYRVQINDTTSIMEATMEPQDVSNWHPVGGFYYVTGAGASVNIDLDYWAATGGTTYIRRARLEIWRVS